MLFKDVFSLKKWNKKVGSPSSFGRKRPFTSLNSSALIGNLSSFERARATARANHAKNDAQKGCAMQLNGITLNTMRFVSNFVGELFMGVREVKKPSDLEKCHHSSRVENCRVRRP